MLVSIDYIKTATNALEKINQENFTNLKFIDGDGKEIEITKSHIELVKSLDLTNTDFIINDYYKSNKCKTILEECAEELAN